MSVPAYAGDPRFFVRTGPHDLAAIAHAAGAAIPDGTGQFTGIAPLNAAGPDEVSFLIEKRHAGALAASRAGAVLVTAALAGRVPAGCVPLVVADVHVAWARVVGLFHPDRPATPGRHPSAVVDPSATVDQSAEIGPYVVIGANARIGARCRLAAHAVIGAGVELGSDVRVGAHTSISHALIGDRVVLFPGVRIGQDGFGFAMTPSGFISIPQVGRVIIGNDVEIGANCTIDRGSAGDTVIGMGTRLDNLVMIGHNVRIGRFCVIVAQVGISGSTVLEDFVMVAGQAGLVGHLRIGAGAKIGAQSGVTMDIAAGQQVMGSPARSYKDYARQQILLRRLTRNLTAADQADR